MGQVFHTKLNIKSKKVRENLKKMSGIYRKIFNIGLDAQFYRMTHVPIDQHLLSGTFLHKVVKVGEKELYPYISEVDCGITHKAVFNSNYSFKRWYSLRENRLPVYMARKDGMGFATSTKIKVFYDHISIPKLGDIKLYEKGYIPQGKVYKNVSFSYDGKNWWVSLEACEKSEVTKENLQNSLKISSDMEGNVTVGDVVFKDITKSENYIAQKKKYNKLVKKSKRQKEANTYCSATTGKRTVRTSRNMMKTRNRLQVISSKLREIKKDYFRKIASIVARTKPETVYMLSQYNVSHGHQGYLSRKLRDAGIKELMDMIKRKAESIGSNIERYSEALVIS